MRPWIVPLLVVPSGVPCRAEPQDHAVEQVLSLQRSLVVQVPVVRDISDMRLLEGTEAGQVLIAGTCGAFVLDPATREAEGETAFDLPCPPFLDSTIVDVDGDGRLEFTRFQPGWVGPTSVLERDGSVRWSVETPARCEHPFDLDGDGRVEVLVAEPNSKTIRLLDHRGELVWQREWTGSNVDGFAWDVDGDGEGELIYVDGKALRVCGRDGRELFATTPPGGGYVNAIRFVAGSGVLGEAELLVGAYANERQSYHAYGRSAEEHIAEYSWEEVAPFVGVQRFERRGQALFLKVDNVMQQAFPAGNKSSELRLSMYDAQGVPLFEDTISKPDNELARGEGAALLLDEDPIRLLVGYGDRVWEYIEP